MRFTFVTIEDGKSKFYADLEFPNHDAARREAMCALGEMVRDQADSEPYRDIAIDVTDAEGQHVLRSSMIVR